MAKERKSCLSKRVSRRFVNGLILLVPVVITLLVVSEVLHFTEGVLGKHLPFYFPGLGIITVVLVIYFVGWISSYWIMRRLIHYGEARSAARQDPCRQVHLQQCQAPLDGRL